MSAGKLHNNCDDDDDNNNNNNNNVERHDRVWTQLPFKICMESGGGRV
jgi:hypothetical protein